MPGDSWWRRRRPSPVPAGHATLVASGLVDVAWVAAQVARPLADVGAAVAAYVCDPELSPHPLVEPDWVDPRRPWVAQGRSGLAWYLDDPGHRVRSPHPLVSLARILEQLPSAVSHPAGPVAAWLETATDASTLPSRPGTPPLTLGRLRELAVAGLGPAVAGPTPTQRVAGRVSVVLTLGAETARTVNWVRSVGELAATGTDVELAAVGGGLARSHRVLAHTVATTYAVHVPLVLDAPVEATAAAGLGVDRASGGRLVLVRPSVVPDARAAVELAGALGAPGVVLAQPLLLDRRDVVVAAGAVFADDTTASLEPFLAGHAAEDAIRLGLQALPAPLGPVLATTPELIEAAGGLDGGLTGALAEVDLGIRARAHGSVVLDPDCRFTWTGGALPGSASHNAALESLAARRPAPPAGSDALLRRAGFEPATYRLLRDQGVRTPRMQVTEHAPRLRWTLDTAARAGAAGRTWGDTHFAGSMAAALRRLGQQVAVDPAPARERWSRALDDVVLVVRGLDRVVPEPGPLSLLWVISHPDEVTADEVAAYDLAFAASLSWSASRSAAWGLRVEPLLQCTDPALFRPGRAVADSGDRVLFVGNARGTSRPVLAGALAAGADVTVHGTGWAPVLPDLRVASSQVANDDLGALYAAAHVVLNDHWADMRRDGFVSNRLFDATASGARVVSDDIAGVHELFGVQVRTFTDPAEVGALLAGVPDAWPDVHERHRLAAHVADQHSFDRRASTLLAAAVRGLRARGDFPGRPGN